MDCLHDSSPYHQALVLQGLSKCQEEEAKPELLQVIVYARAINAQALKHTMDIDWRAIITIEGLDLTMTDLETRVQDVGRKQGNEQGIQGVLVEAWGKAMNTSDAMDWMDVDLEGVVNWVDRAENTLVEVDEQVEHLE